MLSILKNLIWNVSVIVIVIVIEISMAIVIVNLVHYDLCFVLGSS